MHPSANSKKSRLGKRSDLVLRKLDALALLLVRERRELFKHAHADGREERDDVLRALLGRIR